ncbi:MAG: DUF2125 domain-containing protein [Proteobacteria bacterium]|nr:DUF2125 domain-containing protein [Pseudomonadota bacterium]
MSIFSRRSLIGPVVLLLGLAILYPVFWFYAADRAEGQLAVWVNSLRAQGYGVKHGLVTVDGFPGVIRLKIEKPHLSAPNTSWRWRGERAEFNMQPWNWWRFRVELPGRHRVNLANPSFKRPVELEPQKALMVFRFYTNGRLAEGELILKKMRVTDAERALILSVDDMWIKAAQPEKTQIGAKDASLSFSTALENLLIPAAAKGPLGENISRLQFIADLKGPVPQDFTRQGVEEWRRAGGTLDASWLNLLWGFFDLSGRGTLSLDDRHRPLGALTADIRGYSETLDALEAFRFLNRTSAATARLALSVLAKPSPTDGVKVLTVPVSAREGALLVGPFQILKLRPLSLPSR